MNEVGKKLQSFLTTSTLAQQSKMSEIVVGTENKVKGQRLQSDWKIDRDHGKVVEEVKVLISNLSAKPQLVNVHETLYRWESGKVTSSSHKYTTEGCSIIFEENVAGNANLDITYTVEYTYKR